MSFTLEILWWVLRKLGWRQRTRVEYFIINKQDLLTGGKNYRGEMNEKKRKNGSYNLTIWKEILIILRVVGEEERKVGKIHTMIYIFFSALWERLSKQKVENYFHDHGCQCCISFNILLYIIKVIIDTSPTGSWILLELHIKISVIYNVIYTFQVNW